jgi:hypothetical protein
LPAQRRSGNMLAEYLNFRINANITTDNELTLCFTNIF